MEPERLEKTAQGDLCTINHRTSNSGPSHYPGFKDLPVFVRSTGTSLVQM